LCLETEHGPAEVYVVDSVTIITLPLQVAVTRNHINLFKPITETGPYLPGQLAVAGPDIGIAGEIPFFAGIIGAQVLFDVSEKWYIS